jgi:rare lipoprotein A
MIFKNLNFKHFLMTILLVLLTACGSDDEKITVRDGQQVVYQKVGKPYQINGVWYYPKIDPHYDDVGIASWYGPGFDGKSTANGETYDMNGVSAAHKTLPLPTYVEVTNLENNRQLNIRVNDRGPFVDDRIIDLSKGAAERLGTLGKGVARVRVRVIDPPENIVLVPKGQGVEYANGTKPQASTQVTSAPAYTLPPATNVDTSTLSPVTNSQSIKNHAYSTGSYNNNNYQSVSQPQNAGNYAIKIGTFANYDNVQKLQQNLAREGQVNVEPIYAANGTTLHKVLVKGYSNRYAAEQSLVNIRNMGIPDAQIIVN